MTSCFKHVFNVRKLQRILQSNASVLTRIKYEGELGYWNTSSYISCYIYQGTFRHFVTEICMSFQLKQN